VLRAAEAEAGTTLREAFAADPNRAARMRLSAAGLSLDYSRARIGPAGLAALFAHARAAGLEAARDAMAAGEPVNPTEGRAAHHIALRAADPPDIVAETAAAAAAQAEAIRRGGTQAVLWLGIGGSDFGPRLVVDALCDRADGPEIRFVSTVDGVALDRALTGLDPARTRVIVASKSFTTEETMLNARSAWAWMESALGARATGARFAAVTARPGRAETFGIDRQAILPIWDWVGGRFSVWSAVGLAIRIALGNAAFARLLAGARAMDAHFLGAPLEANMPVILAALDLWTLNALGMESLAIVPYAQRLALLPAYLQQLIMESNGKGVTTAGTAAPARAAPVIWGAPGTDAEHSFFQWLHQSPAGAPVEFLLPVAPETGRPAHQRALIAHCLAQGSALMLGRDLAETRAALAAEGLDETEIARLAPHRVFPGNRPSVTILMRDVEAQSLGALIALYEHRVAAQAAMLGINAFDQWGVEFGKTLAGRIRPLLEGSEDEAPDPATAALIAEIVGWR